jgi:hypothetical protein
MKIAVFVYVLPCGLVDLYWLRPQSVFLYPQLMMHLWIQGANDAYCRGRDIAMEPQSSNLVVANDQAIPS